MRDDTENSPGSSEDRFDDEWQQIVSSMPDLAKQSDSQIMKKTQPEGDSSVEDTTNGRNETPAPVAGPRDWVEPEEEEGHFVPPDPSPIRGGNPVVIACWSAIVISAIGLILCAIFWSSVPRFIPFVLLAAFLAGCIILIRRTPFERDPTDTDGGGAVL